MAKTKSSKQPKGVTDLVITPQRRQQVFAFFWAIAILMNNFKQAPGLADSAIEDILNFVTFLIAVSLLFQPANTNTLILLAGLSTIQWIGFLPRMPNHWMIIGMINAAILVVWLHHQLTKKTRTEHWFSKAEPLLRISFITCYGAAALVKWNSDFIFDMSVSCSVDMAGSELEWLGINIDFSSMVWFPWLIALTETAIFALPLFWKFRAFGVMLASLFHLSLSLTPISQGLGFTYTLWPLLLLFLSDKSYEATLKLGNQVRSVLTKKVDVALIRFVVTAFWGYIFFKYLIHPVRNEFDEMFVWLFRLAVGIVVGVGLAYVAWVGRGDRLKTRVFRIKGLNQYLIYSLVVLNVLAPYIGLKTYSTMTMYSNIKVEQGSTNHFVFPVIPVFNYLNDVVEIKGTNLEYLQRRTNSEMQITWLELQRIMSQAPGAAISYVRDGETFTYRQAKENPELVTPNQIALKLLSNRPVSQTNRCLW
jgi:hypothetical protein